MLSHTLQFAVLLATFTNLTQHTLYVCWSQWRHSKTHWERWGPGYLVAISTLCIMVQPTYLVLQVAQKAPTAATIIKVAPDFSGHFYKQTRQGLTIVGYALLFIGIMWATSLHTKLRALCGGDRRAAATADV